MERRKSTTAQRMEETCPLKKEIRPTVLTVLAVSVVGKGRAKWGYIRLIHNSSGGTFFPSFHKYMHAITFWSIPSIPCLSRRRKKTRKEVMNLTLNQACTFYVLQLTIHAKYLLFSILNVAIVSKLGKGGREEFAARRVLMRWGQEKWKEIGEAHIFLMEEHLSLGLPSLQSWGGFNSAHVAITEKDFGFSLRSLTWTPLLMCTILRPSISSPPHPLYSDSSLRYLSPFLLNEFSCFAFSFLLHPLPANVHQAHAGAYPSFFRMVRSATVDVDWRLFLFLLIIVIRLSILPPLTPPSLLHPILIYSWTVAHLAHNADETDANYFPWWGSSDSGEKKRGEETLSG